MAQRIALLLCILLCFASCGISKTSSRFSNGDKATSAYFPKKVIVQLCETDPSLKLEIIDVLATNLTDGGIEVVAPENPNALADICRGVLPDGERNSLRGSPGIDGVFIGVFEQRRVEPMLLTRFELKLIDYSSGKLIWTTNVKTDHFAPVANARTAALQVAAMAAESFNKDVLGKPRQRKK